MRDAQLPDVAGPARTVTPATRADYRRGCRTPECRAANATYEQRRQRRKVPPFVAAGRARTHVRELLAGGLTVWRIAQRAGVRESTVYRLLGSCCGYSKSRRIRPKTERALLAVRADVVTPETTRNADRLYLEPWFVDLKPVPPDTDTAWRDLGACRDPNIPVDVFFPGRGDLETSMAARKICAGCQVRARCLDYALATEQLGIWGGATEQQRQRMLGQRGGGLADTA